MYSQDLAQSDICATAADTIWKDLALRIYNTRKETGLLQLGKVLRGSRPPPPARDLLLFVTSFCSTTNSAHHHHFLEKQIAQMFEVKIREDDVYEWTSP